MSIVENLIQNSGLKFREKPITLSDDELKILDELGNKFKSNNELKLFFQLPESNSLMLRLIITELAYLSVEKQNVYFLTDGVGKSFLFNTLKDLNTGITDVYNLLMKSPHQRVKITHPDKINGLDYDSSLFVHFRNKDINGFFSSAKRQIIIFTSRDHGKNGKEYSEISSDLKEKSWSELYIHLPKKQTVKEKIAKIDLVDDEAIYNFFNYLDSFALEPNTFIEKVEEYGYFYSSLPVPIKYYYSYYDYEFRGPKNEPIIPSEAFSKSMDIEASKRLAIEYLCKQIEKETFEKNMKFDHLVSLAEFCHKNGEQTAILFPNKLFSEAFVWALENINTEFEAFEKYNFCWYPELLSRELLLDEHIVDCIFIPFVPSGEILIDSSNLASKIILVLYQHEKQILEQSLNKNLDSSVLNNLSLSSSSSDKQMEPKKPYNHSKNWANLNFKINYDTYRRFIRYLEKDDVLEGQVSFEYSAVVDSNKYIITSQDGEKFSLHGWQHIILQKPGALFNNYCWVSLQDVKKNQTITIVSNELRFDYLQKELSNNMKEIGRNLNDLVDYVSDWKSALSSVADKHSISEVQNLLKNNGLSRNYVTIRNWFEGLDSDPKESATAAIINPGYNIGPQDRNDIKIFGETFRIQKLIDNYKYISAAMEYFRTSNRRTGRKVMRQILQDVKNETITQPLKTIKIKDITIKEN